MDKNDKINCTVNIIFIVIGVLFCLLKKNALDIVESVISFGLLVYGIFLRDII